MTDDDASRRPARRKASSSVPAGLVLDATVAQRDVAVGLAVAAGETVALFGPNGAGKSTVLDVVAGLLRPSAGGVTLGGRALGAAPPHERQVALLAQEPLLFPHLDEPMAALDVAVAPALRQTLRTVLADRTVLLVTHDALDALLLADRVVVLDHGRVVEEGPTRDVLARPRSAFAAQVAGLNLVAGTWEDDAVRHPSLDVRGLCAAAPARGTEVVAVFSPSAVAVFPQAPAGSPRNSFEATVTDVEPLGDRVRVRTVVGEQAVAAEVTPGAAAELDLVPGARVHLLVKAVEVAVHPTGP
ncbi:MAG: ATP-binding cassette domain-containing protein [Actinomycetales bacterium]|nr:MAG: ATP-binding cassette domain-containing protein [Actinomycetales bacterium]